MVLINATFAVFSLLWLISQIAQADLDPELWFALAFTLLCAANTVNLLGRRQRRQISKAGRPTGRQGQPLARRPDVPSAYGVLDADDGEGLKAWPEVNQRLSDARTYWVCTTRPSGRPHAVPVWGVWLDESFYFGTHRDSRKARNLLNNPYLALHLDSSEQVVIVEGLVGEVGDPGLRAQVGRVYGVKYALPAEEPGHDPNPMFALRPRLAFAWSGDDFAASATRWTFEE